MLHFRAGDSQALKVAAAAKIAAAPLSVTAGTDASAKGQNPFATSTLAFVASDGLLLTEANTAAKMISEF